LFGIIKQITAQDIVAEMSLEIKMRIGNVERSKESVVKNAELSK
jgi:hypothetical protein